MGDRRLLLIFVLRRGGAAIGAEQILLVEDRAAHRAFFENIGHGEICTLSTRETASELSRLADRQLPARLRFRAVRVSFWQSTSNLSDYSDFNGSSAWRRTINCQR